MQVLRAFVRTLIWKTLPASVESKAAHRSHLAVVRSPLAPLHGFHVNGGRAPVQHPRKRSRRLNSHAGALTAHELGSTTIKNASGVAIQLRDTLELPGQPLFLDRQVAGQGTVIHTIRVRPRSQWLV